jgi:hypothetical protein
MQLLQGLEAIKSGDYLTVIGDWQIRISFKKTVMKSGGFSILTKENS